MSLQVQRIKKTAHSMLVQKGAIHAHSVLLSVGLLLILNKQANYVVSSASTLLQVIFQGQRM